MDTTAVTGPVVKSVKVVSNDDKHSLVVLVLKANVLFPSEIKGKSPAGSSSK